MIWIWEVTVVITETKTKSFLLNRTEIFIKIDNENWHVKSRSVQTAATHHNTGLSRLVQHVKTLPYADKGKL